MTPEERANQVFSQILDDGLAQTGILPIERIAQAIQTALEEEREACARIADDAAEVIPAQDIYREDYRFAAEIIGRNIRARSNEKQGE